MIEKNTISIILSLFLICNALYSQISLGPETAIGINKCYNVGMMSTRVGIDNILPAHSYSVGAEVNYQIKASGYSINLGLGLLNQPVIYVLSSSYVFSRYEEQEIRYDTFRRKLNYYFLQTPLTVTRQYDSGFRFGLGINFKYYLSNFTTPDNIFYSFEYRNFNWGALMLLGFQSDNNIYIGLKSEFENPGFITEELVGETTIFANFNTMLNISYIFNIKR